MQHIATAQSGQHYYLCHPFTAVSVSHQTLRTPLLINYIMNQSIVWINGIVQNAGPLL